VKTATVCEKMDKIEDENKQLRADLQSQFKQIEKLALNEMKRSQKEQTTERQLLIRDLLVIGRERLIEEFNNRQLSKNKIGALYNINMDITQLSSKHPAVYEVLNDVANEFGLNSAQFLILLREKRQGNHSFHINREIKHYARTHKTIQNYDLNDFLEKQSMHQMDAENLLLLQPVFSQVCKIINKEH
jgi:hypothetical protein